MGLIISGGGSSAASPTKFMAPTTGQYLAPAYAGNTTYTPVSGQLLYIPLIVPASLTFDRIGLHVSGAAGTTGTSRLGIYNAVNGRPSGAPAFDGGTVSLMAIADVEATISQTLAAGFYFIGCLTEFTGAAPGIQAFAGTQQCYPVNVQSAVGASNQRTALMQTGATGALPTAAPTTTNAVAPIITLRVA